MDTDYITYLKSYFNQELNWIFFQLSRKTTILPLFLLEQRVENVLQFSKNILENKSVFNDDRVSICKKYLKYFYLLIPFTRDTLWGLGEHDLTYSMICAFYNTFPSLAYESMQLILTPLDNDNKNQNIGSWRDIKYLCQYVYDISSLKHKHPLIKFCISLVNEQLIKDIETWKYSVNCFSVYHISNVAKHIPRETSKFSWLFEKLAIDFVTKTKPCILSSPKTLDSYQKALSKTKRIYRKNIVFLNKALSTPQIQFCEKRKDLNIVSLTKHTYIKNQQLFSKNTNASFLFFNKLNNFNYEHPFYLCGHNFCHVPVEYIIKRCVLLHDQENIDSQERNFLNILWEKYASKLYNKKDYIIPILDVSDCTNNNSFYAALGNALLLTYNSHFQNRIIAVDKSPTWIKIDPSFGILEQVTFFMKSIYNMSNTSCNFQKAFQLLSTTMKSIRATNNQVESTKVVILSSFKHPFSYENFMQTFKDKWFYAFPYLILWNFSNENCISLPGQVKKKYIFTISGYSFNQIFNVLYANRNKTSFQNITSILKKDRYTPFTNFIEFYLDFKYAGFDEYLPIY